MDRYGRLSFVFAGILLLTALVPAQTSATPPPPRPMTLGVIGASVSAGFGSGVRVADAMDAAIRKPHRLLDRSTVMFFVRYKKSTPKILAEFKKEDVDGIVALDYLFWFAAGKKSYDERARDVKSAVDQILALGKPVILGAVPPLRHVSPRILSPDKVAPLEDVRRLNTLVAKLIANRKDVVLLPVDRWIDALEKKTPIPELASVGAKAVAASDIFQRDGLHLSRTGTAFATLMVLRALTHDAGLLKENESLRTLEDMEHAMDSKGRRKRPAPSKGPQPTNPNGEKKAG
ncbi:MAG TPA: hypothetical protein ENK43_15665 [Planctomycetes bacterium]|nr:hypothetical protein [Planctomycetota bacterium]